MGRFDSEFTPREKAGPSDPVPAAFDLTAFLADYCGEWMGRNGQSRMPVPCPMSARDTAEWWLSSMFLEPEPKAADGPEYGREVSAYAAAARAALRGFLAMPKAKRETVANVAGSVAYRGEPFAQYLDICVETDTMRDDPDAYRRGAMARMKAAISRPAIGLGRLVGDAA